MTTTPMHAPPPTPILPTALGAQATKHAAETALPRPITTPNDVHPTRPAAETAEGATAQGRTLSGNEFTAVAVVAALVAVLGLLGFVNSFAAVADAARPSFGRLAWSVPLGIDLGIAIFAALDIVLARLDMRVRWLRFIVWTLTGATVYLNVAEQATAFGRIAHAVLPCLWVVAVEIAAHVVKVRAGIQAGTRMDGIRTSRWVLAPWPTLKLWRRMVLWETRSYPDALTRERDRVLALTDLKDAYGALAWRWKAPRRVKALYRLGELAPAPQTGGPAPAPSVDRPALLAARPVGTEPDGTADQTGTSSATASRTVRRTGAGKPGGRSASKTSGRSASTSARSSRALSRTAKRPVPDVDGLMPLGWRIVADLQANGQPLTRDTLAAQLRAAGQSAGNARVGALLARLKSEAPADPADPAEISTTATATRGDDA